MNLPATPPEQLPPGRLGGNPGHPDLFRLQLLAKREIGALVVLNGDQFVAKFSEQDHTPNVVLAGTASKEQALRAALSGARAEPSYSAQPAGLSDVPLLTPSLR